MYLKVCVPKEKLRSERARHERGHLFDETLAVRWRQGAQCLVDAHYVYGDTFCEETNRDGRGGRPSLDAEPAPSVEENDEVFGIE